MGLSPYIERIRRSVGPALLLLPTVAVLPRDAAGRLLLVRLADFGQWATIGGTIEPDEAPETAARREALEEAGVVVELTALRAAVGGPGYRITYPNGDETSCVAIVFDAVVASGSPTPDHDETTEVGWFSLAELAALDLGDFNRRLINEVLPLD